MLYQAHAGSDASSSHASFCQPSYQALECPTLHADCHHRVLRCFEIVRCVPMGGFLLCFAHRMGSLMAAYSRPSQHMTTPLT
mmetsp:Transcript_14950/g.40338  ORF Transcript_14950/g.40338 Transcript_14950/m.40338 type:complete len:82 (-) Transcript_14950:171-416(-)